MNLASLDGQIGPPHETMIPVTDEGLLRGDGAFEVMRLYAGQPFALDDHLARLRRSCEGLRLDADHDAVAEELGGLLAAAGPVDGLLRVVVTRGGRRIAMVEPLPERPPAARVATVTFAPGRVLDGLKTLSYAANMLAGRLAKERGFDEALFVSPHGRVLEGPTWTFFWVSGGDLFTPPLEERILSSITRARILEDGDVTEAVCTLEDVRGAEEAFIASTVREVMPIAAIDDHELASVPGPVTLQAHARFQRRVELELSTSVSRGSPVS